MATPDAAQPLGRRLSYAQCWEDWRVLVKALRPGPDDRVLSIASAGCNSLALALQGAHVVALDLSEPQLALCELKLAGGHVPYPRFLILLGLADGDPLDVLAELRQRLSPSARTFWDAHHDLLRQGVLGAGRFERYLALFRRRILPLIHGPERIRELIDAKSPAEQRRFYQQRWHTRRWRWLFRIFFSRRVMARLGRSPEQFSQVEGAVADRILARAEQVLGGMSLDENPYVQWILEGGFRDLEQAHPYLSRQGHAQLPEIAERLQLVHAPLQEHLPACPEGRYTAFNLSNIGEYLPAGAFAQLYGELVRAGRSGAHVAYWNLFVHRQRPVELASCVQAHPLCSADLLRQDRVPFYGAFRLEVLR